jgi:hypothetical protein
MNLFQTFFDALKINWKQKPMWKLTLLAYVPLSFVFSSLLVPLILAAGYFYKDTGTFLDNLGSIFFLLLFVVILFINTLLSVMCLLVSQVGSSSMMLQYQMDPNAIGTNKISPAFLKKVWSGVLYYLVIIGIPNLIFFILAALCLALTFATENVLFIFLFICIILIALPIAMGLGLLFYIFLPIFTDQNSTIKEKIKKSWAYLSSQLGNILLFSLIIYGFLFVISYAINVPLQIFSMLLYFGLMAGIVLLESSPALAVLLFILIYVAFIMVTFLYSGILYLAMGAIQSGFTLLYYRVHNTAGKEQSILPAENPNKMLE